MNVKLAPLAVVLSAATLSASAGVNLLANAGFEDPISGDGPPFVGSWETFSADANQDTGADIARNSTAMPRSGAQSLELIIDNTANVFAGLFQDVDGLSGGQEVTFSGWHKSLAGAGGIEIRIEWRDSINDVEISRTSNFVPTPGSEYELFEFDSVVAAGADTARIVYAIQSFGGVADQLIYVDDTSFVVVPAPGALALVGLGGIVCTRRRR